MKGSSGGSEKARHSSRLRRKPIIHPELAALQDEEEVSPSSPPVSSPSGNQVYEDKLREMLENARDLLLIESIRGNHIEAGLQKQLEVGALEGDIYEAAVRQRIKLLEEHRDLTVPKLKECARNVVTGRLPTHKAALIDALARAWSQRSGRVELETPSSALPSADYMRHLTPESVSNLGDNTNSKSVAQRYGKVALCARKSRMHEVINPLSV